MGGCVVLEENRLILAVLYEERLERRVGMQGFVCRKPQKMLVFRLVLQEVRVVEREPVLRPGLAAGGEAKASLSVFPRTEGLRIRVLGPVGFTVPEGARPAPLFEGPPGLQMRI